MFIPSNTFIRNTRVTSWKEFLISFKKWHFEFFRQAKASTFTMSTDKAIIRTSIAVNSIIHIRDNFSLFYCLKVSPKFCQRFKGSSKCRYIEYMDTTPQSNLTYQQIVLLSSHLLSKDTLAGLFAHRKIRSLAAWWRRMHPFNLVPHN